MFVALRLARKGFWGGDPDKVLMAPSDKVIAALQYDAFVDDYESAYIELNSHESS